MIKMIHYMYQLINLSLLQGTDNRSCRFNDYYSCDNNFNTITPYF